MKNNVRSILALRYSILCVSLLVLFSSAYAKDGSVTSVTDIAQVKKVTGVVKDEVGQPLIGVTVFLRAGVGTVTDINGVFTLDNVPEDAILTISYVGYTEVKVPVAGKDTINVTLEPDEMGLDEVVVIGYGVQKKSNVTGAISSLKADDFKNSPITDAAAALQGKVAGVQVVSNSGSPGAAPTIRVRGYSSNGSSDPLYIVDGLKVSDISYLDPNSIKNMEILKDAASAAIYGAEAGNGVILITTKTGNKGKTGIGFDAQWIYSSLAKKVDMMNAEKYRQFYTEGAGEGFTSLYDQYNISGTDTDWQDEMYETGDMQKYNLNMEGGNDSGSFFISLGYMNNDGMVKKNKDYYKRINGQINASYNIRPWLEVGTANTISTSNRSSMTENNFQYGMMKDILNIDPLTPVYYTADNMPERIRNSLNNGLHPTVDSDGNYYGYSWVSPGAVNANPLMAVENANSAYRTFFINGMTHANIKPFKNFVFTSRLGYTLGNISENTYVPIRLDSFFDDADTPLTLKSNQYSTRYYQWENFFNYTLETKEAGNFSIMGGMSYSDYERVTTLTQTNDLSSTTPNFVYMDYSTNGADDYVGGNILNQRKIAYYGRLSWSYLDRYNFQTNFRADSYDAAYLDLEHNWGYFPSVSIGWIFSNEDFMKDVTGGVFTFGKLRASYGVNGSISNLGNYMYAATLRTGQFDTSTNTANMAYYINGELYQGTYPNSFLANPKLRWERSTQRDLGLDLRFFNDRLSATVDYYYKLTDGLLVQSVAPLITGTSSVYQNLGEVENSGVELELEWNDRIGDDFRYGIKGNIATVNNKVKKYHGEGSRISGAALLATDNKMTFFEEGYPLWYIRGYKLEGVNAQTGEAIYADITGDGEITDADRTELGKGIPDFTYGLTLSASWKNIDFSIYGAGSGGNQLVYALMSTSFDSRANRPTFLYEDRWTGTNTQASLPSAMYQVNDVRFYNSDALVFDASFFKIKQLQLGYTMPKKWLKPIAMESLRAFVSMDNFFTFTDYPGSDPEINSSSEYSHAMAVDYGGYPLSRSVSFGFNVTF